MSDNISRSFDKLWRRFALMVGRGRTPIGNDSGIIQTLQVQVNDSEIHDDMHRVAEYGFTSMPLPGCQTLVIFVGGDRSNGVVCGTSDERNRLKNLQPGEVAIYDDQGQSVYITRAGIIINGAGKTISLVNAPHVTHDGVNIGKDHTHPVSGVVAGGSTVESSGPQ